MIARSGALCCLLLAVAMGKQKIGTIGKSREGTASERQVGGQAGRLGDQKGSAVVLIVSFPSPLLLLECEARQGKDFAMARLDPYKLVLVTVKIPLSASAVTFTFTKHPSSIALMKLR